MAVKIVTETGCDLPPALIEQLDICLVPLILRFDERVVPDSDQSRQELWARIEAGLPCATSGPPIGAYLEAFDPLVAAGHEVVCITLTGAHSVTYSSAWAAAQDFPGRVTVCDSRSISVGCGFQVVEAARLALAGASMPAIVEAAEGVHGRTSIRFYLESLEQLRRGGRADSLMPILSRLGRALNIVPILTFNDEGRIALVGPARGGRGGIKRLVADMLATAPVEAIAVAHARRPQVAAELADELADQLHFPREEIIVSELGPVITAHAGDGAIGVGTVRKR